MNLEDIKNIDFWQDSVVDIVVNKGKITGIKTGLGVSFNCKAVILAKEILSIFFISIIFKSF